MIGALNLFYGISVIAGSHIFITTAAWLTDDAQPWGGLMVVVGLIQMASAPAVFLFRGWAIAIWNPAYESCGRWEAPSGARGPLKRRNPRQSEDFRGTATGIRTRVSGLRIRRPSPLDDSGV